MSEKIDAETFRDGINFEEGAMDFGECNDMNLVLNWRNYFVVTNYAVRGR